ncbi:hypothetical protein ScPMuIL_005916 [Solemya velum]
MGKRYYCDYCDKSFADTANSRKNHLKGVHHQRMRKLHYDSFRDPSVILAEERGKKPCKMFQSTGYCDFGNSCRFSHMLEQNFKDLEAQVHKGKETGKQKKAAGDNDPTLEQWLEERAKKPKTEVKKKVRDSGIELPQYTLAPCLMNIPNLPPSLRPPPKDAYKYLTLEEWG